MFTNQNQKFLVGAIASLILIAGCGGGTGSASKSSSAGGSNSGNDTTQTSGPSSGGVTVTNVYSEPKQLKAGDVLYLDLNSQKASLDFNGVDSNAEFIFAVANTSSSSSSFSVQISGDLSDLDFDVVKSVENFSDNEDFSESAVSENDLTEQFHEILRQREVELESLEIPSDPEVAISASKASLQSVDAAISEGDSRSFKVLASLSSSSSSVEVNARADCVGSNVAFYIDERVTQDILSNSEVRSICAQFDATAFKEQELFGSLSDVNNDGKVIVLMTPQVNKLGASGGGIVTGFFNASDLYASNAVSNFMEILYIMVPDPNGTFGTPVSKSFALSNLIPSVLPHELQHAINYNQHVIVSKGSSENPWLNEGLSHLAEDLLGQNQENPSRYNLFLKNPSAYSLVKAGSPGLASRGAAYLFLRFLYEQSENPTQFLRNLLQTSLSGVANIEKAFSGRAGDFDQFGEFFLRWSVALAMSDAGLSQDRRFTYQSRVKNESTGQWSGVLLKGDAQDGRSTVLNGVSIKSYNGYTDVLESPSTSRFFKVSNVKDKLSFNNSGNTSEGYGILIRTK